MICETTVSIAQMKEALAREVDSRFPLKITRKDGEVMIRYFRGFADAQHAILLISESSFTLALRILEIKDIRTLEYARENTGGQWKVVHLR